MYDDQHTPRKILEHLEKKYHKDQPIDIEAEQKILNEPPDSSAPNEKYFAKLQTVKKKLEDTEEPVQAATLKRIVRGQLQKIPHLQQYVNHWDDKKDPDGTKTYKDMREYFIQKDLNNHANKTALGAMGIANAATNNQVNDDCIEGLINALEKVTANQVALGKAVNELKAGVSFEDNKENKENTNNNRDSLEEKIKSVLAASGFKPKKPKTEVDILQDKLKALEKKFKSASANGGGGGGGRGGSYTGQRGYRKPERKPTAGWKYYCSSCGTNKTHPSSECKDKQLWHKDEATYENQMGGYTKNNHLWHDASVP